MAAFKVGDEVVIRAKVDRAPEEGTKLYRLITPEGTVVWASEQELETDKEKD